MGTGDGSEFLHAKLSPIPYDRQTDTLTKVNLGENRSLTEPIYAPDALNAQQGWILTIVFDRNTDSSEVYIFDLDKLDEEPVGKLGLPSVVPIEFHGIWKPEVS